MAGHTPTPWVAVRHEQDDRFWDVRDVETNCSIIDTENSGCGSDPSPDDVFFTEANAAFIVRACNAHEDLLAACEDFLSLLRSDFEGIGGRDLSGGQIARVEAILAKARG